MIYKEGKFIGRDAWNVITLTGNDKLHLCYSSATETASELFWVETTTGIPISFQQYLGERPAVQLALLLANNQRTAKEIIKSLIYCTDTKLLASIAPVLVAQLNNANNRQSLSPASLGRFVFLLLQQKRWDEAKKFLSIKNIGIDVNSYCDLETGEYALHLATAAQQTEIVTL